jgi:hypothetical protein
MIYTLRRSPHNEDYLDGYATGHEGLCSMAHAYVREYFNYNDHLDVMVKDGEVIVREPDGCEYSFYISTLFEYT